MDFIFKGESETGVLIPESDRAKQWALDNLQVKDWQTILKGIIIESCVIYEIVDILIANDLNIVAL
jgi:hypothetical protein